MKFTGKNLGKNSTRNIIILIIATVLIFTLSLLAALLVLKPGILNDLGLRDSVSQGAQSDETIEIADVEFNFPIILITSFRSDLVNVQVGEELEVEGKNVYASQVLTELMAHDSNESSILDGLAEFPAEVELEVLNDPESEFYEAILAVHPSELVMQYKVLRVDNVHPLREYRKIAIGQEDETSYPLIASLTVTEPDYQTKYRQYDYYAEGVSSIFAAGEIIPARAVDRLLLNVYNDYTILYDRFREELGLADISVALLENPLSGDPAPCTGCTVFVSDERNAAGLAEVGFDLLGFGNHIADGGRLALERTEQVLDEAGVLYTGASSQSLTEAEKLITKDMVWQDAEGGEQTTTVGMLAFDDVAYFAWAAGGEGYTEPARWGANRFSKPGTRGAVPDFERIERLVSAAAEEVDLLIIYASWGIEYRDTANESQQQFAHAFIDAGADLVLGTHPHWIQNFEIYNDKPIFYSLGNFIFDQTHTDPTRQGIVVNSYLYQGEIVSLEVIPQVACGYHQTNNNLASRVISGEMSYAEVDSTPENQGCIYWQPKPSQPGSTHFQQAWDRFIKSTRF